MNSADRETLWQQLRQHPVRWDVLIVGGGITGAGVLRECTRRGLKALLVEQQDFAWGTSSKSSKMVHGGLRYLASGQFGLTRDSVRERQRLLEEAPGLVDPLQFLMGHYKGQFPPGFIFNRVLDVYDLMAGHRNHRRFPAREVSFLAPGLLENGLKSLTQFGDAVTDDARLVLRVLQEARSEGGCALNYVKAENVLKGGSEGRVRGLTLQDTLSGDRVEVEARVVINATGAWADQLRGQMGLAGQIRPLRGSHLVLPQWRFPVSYSVSYFHPRDKRPVFVFPWEGTTVIGTTDLDHDQDMSADARITPEEVNYLLEGIRHAFPSWRITREDVLCTWSGIRPVVGTGSLDPSKEKREHSIWDDQGLITVAGGKLTTFRLIAMDVLQAASIYLEGQGHTVADSRIFKAGRVAIKPDCGVAVDQQKRWWGRYGEVTPQLIAGGSPAARRIGDSLVCWGELDYALQHEAVCHLDDLLLRRTRLGQLLPQGAKDYLPEIGLRCQRILGWNDAQLRTEIDRYQAIYARDFSLPPLAQPAAGALS